MSIFSAEWVMFLACDDPKSPRRWRWMSMCMRMIVKLSSRKLKKPLKWFAISVWLLLINGHTYLSLCSDHTLHLGSSSRSANFPDSLSSDANKSLINCCTSPRCYVLAKTSVENMRVTLVGFSLLTTTDCHYHMSST